MTLRIREAVLLGTLMLGLAVGAGCKKDGKDGKDGKGGDKGGGKGSHMGHGKGGGKHGLALEDQTLDFKDFSVKMQAPKGWKKASRGTGPVMFTAPKGGIFPSWIRVASTCEGVCSTIAENIRKAGDSAMKQQQAAKVYTALKLVKNEATPKGHRYRLTFVYHGKPGVQLSTYTFQKGWDGAVQCTAMLLKRQAKHADAFAKLCDSLVVTKK